MPPSLPRHHRARHRPLPELTRQTACTINPLPRVLVAQLRDPDAAYDHRTARGVRACCHSPLARRRELLRDSLLGGRGAGFLLLVGGDGTTRALGTWLVRCLLDGRFGDTVDSWSGFLSAFCILGEHTLNVALHPGRRATVMLIQLYLNTASPRQALDCQWLA